MGDYYVGSFMGGLGRGWDQGKKMADDVRERRMRKDIEQASQERAEVDAGMEDEALWRSDNSAQQARMLEEQTGGMGLHRVRGKEYGRLSDATQAADKFNSLEGRYGRLAGVYARHGQAEKAMAFEKAIQDIAQQKQVADEATKRTAIAEKTFARQEGDWAKSDALDAALAQASRGYAGDQASMRVALGDLSRMTPEEWAMISAGKADMSVLGQLGGLQRGEGDLNRALAGAYEQFGGAKGVADANRLRKEARAYDKEGLSEALDKARAGDMLGATMLWNGKGEFTGQIPTRVYTDPKTKEEYVEWVDLRTGKAGKASTAELEMNVKERRTDELARREQARKEKHDADWLMAQREQNAATLKAAGLRTSGSDVAITPEQQAKLQDLNTRYYAATDPKARAAIAQDLQVLQNEIAIRNKRFPSLGGLAKESKAPDALTFKDFAASYGSGDPAKDVLRYKEYQLLNMPIEDLAAAMPNRGGKTEAGAKLGGGRAAQGKLNKSEWELIEQPMTQSWRPGKWVWRNIVTGDYMSEDAYRNATK